MMMKRNAFVVASLGKRTLFVVSYRINHPTKELVITGELDSSRWSNHCCIAPVVVVVVVVGGGGGVINQIKSNQIKL